MKPLLVFDMDGVLVEVRESYRETIIQTVAQFGGPQLTQKNIQSHKNRGGLNNDWLLSWTLLKENGIEIPYEDVVDEFQRIYRGANNDGLMLRERWMPCDDMFDRLAPRYRFAIFTGRLTEEALWALQHFQCRATFDPLISMRDVEREKPDPDGLLEIRKKSGAEEMIYIGDTADDCRAANAAGGVRFIGVAAPDLPDREVLLRQFEELGASAIIPDINSLEGVL